MAMTQVIGSEHTVHDGFGPKIGCRIFKRNGVQCPRPATFEFPDGVARCTQHFRAFEKQQAS